MLSAEENEFLTRIGPGTPMGTLFRRFWIPALLAEELPAAQWSAEEIEKCTDGTQQRIRERGRQARFLAGGQVGSVDLPKPGGQ